MFGKQVVRHLELAPVTTEPAATELGRRHDLGTPVPTCGDWTLADLIWHLTEVQNFWEYIIGQRPAGPEQYPVPERPADDRVADLLTDRCTHLVGHLDSADPADRAWSWANEQTVAFTIRRQTHEALVHHIDGVMAVGAEIPSVKPTVAADGIDELVTVMLSGVPPWATFEREHDSLRLIAADTGDTWNLGLGRMTGTSPDSGTTYDLAAFELLAGLDDPTATIEAASLDLLLWMWGRRSSELLTVTGDTDLATRLRAAIAESTQ